MEETIWEGGGLFIEALKARMLCGFPALAEAVFNDSFTSF